MVDIEELQNMRQKVFERTVKIHDAMDVPYVTSSGKQVVEMSHGKIIRVIEEDAYHPKCLDSESGCK